MTKKITQQKIAAFQSMINGYYQQYGRPFAWRETRDPYHIIVSEVMLQQTQTHRVVSKYEQFLSVFPDFESLACASLRDVLFVWQGLGYNRRGKALYESAKKVVNEFNGTLPNDPEILVTFPGIGPATAASICAFAFNHPTVFIETNIRAVFIHCFFKGRDDVYDKEIKKLVAATLYQENPREWYYALMDYGVMLKQKYKNPSRKSAHHTKQSTFEGSDRQIRGMILKLLTRNSELSFTQLCDLIPREEQRIKKSILQLCEEKFITQNQQEQYVIFSS